jgi:hypothetical protein
MTVDEVWEILRHRRAVGKVEIFVVSESQGVTPGIPSFLLSCKEMLFG